jgi:molecular chaperone DnaJ
MAKDYYDILGISRTATDDEIKKAYRKAALKHHPDRSKDGDETKFKEVNEAYQVLSDKQKRSNYDQFGQAEAPGFGGGQSYQDGFSGFNNADFDFGNLGDIFENFFSGSAGYSTGRARATRGQDIAIGLEISFKDSYFGVTRKIGYPRVDECPSCKGTGHPSDAKVEKCKACEGSGQEKVTQSTFMGSFSQVINCRTCAGKGKSYSKTCVTCYGEGVKRSEREIEVEIPVGVHDGSTLRVKDGGNKGPGGYGQLYVEIHVKRDSDFVRSDQDIMHELNIDLLEAVLGATIEVPTMNKPVDLKIPAGAQPGQKFRLSGKGFPSINNHTRGDQIVTIRINIPKKLSRQERELYQKLADSKDRQSSTFGNIKKGLGL